MGLLARDARRSPSGRARASRHRRAPPSDEGVRFGFGLAGVAVFAAGSIGAFLALDWPPVLESIVLAYLLAALASRVTLLLSRLLLEPRVRSEDAARYRLVPMPDEAAAFWHLRISVFAAWLAFGWATCEVLDALGFSEDAQSLVAFTLGLGLFPSRSRRSGVGRGFRRRQARQGIAGARRSTGSLPPTSC